MSQMPDKIWLHKDTKYSTSDIVSAYQYEFAREIEDEGIENFVEYVNKKAFIDKACEWLKDWTYFSVNDLTGSLNEEDLVERFRAAMMEDSYDNRRNAKTN